MTVVNTLGSGSWKALGCCGSCPSWPSSCSAKPAAAHRTAVLGRYRRRALTPAGQPVVAADQADYRRAAHRGPALSSQQRDTLAARIEATPWQWVGQELPQFSSAPTDQMAAASVGLRLFTVSQRGGYAPMVGGLGYVLAPATTPTC
ncbi:hypothetical protein I552_5556 [Mycobacterium xenopi 3993]|nr:hypothetical protein I552_5556 [Mycobacterium xenopi 3993]